jgi:hypothetical protein
LQRWSVSHLSGGDQGRIYFAYFLLQPSHGFTLAAFSHHYCRSLAPGCVSARRKTLLVGDPQALNLRDWLRRKAEISFERLALFPTIGRPGGFGYSIVREFTAIGDGYP